MKTENLGKATAQFIRQFIYRILKIKENSY